MELACALEEADLGPLKAKQQEALEVFVSGRDTFVALPTGFCPANPTIIYAILPSVYDKIRGIYSKNYNVYIVSGCASMNNRFFSGCCHLYITADPQPIIAYPKLGRWLHRILMVSVPDPCLACFWHAVYRKKGLAVQD